MPIMRALLTVTLTLGLLWVLTNRLGDLPPLGKLVNPVSGFWKNEEKTNRGHHDLKLNGLQQDITVHYDSSMVPHVFAANDHDLYFMQGYVTARDRLWQMDMQNRTASGRLSEILGPKALAQDRHARDEGLMYAAEKSLRLLNQNPQMRTALEAYTEGVNAWIDGLKPADYPVEFKLLDYAPEHWQPVNCALVMKLMAQTLNESTDDFGMTNDLNALGEATMNELFPNHPFRDDPVIPKGTPASFQPVSIPSAPVYSATDGARETITAPRQEGIGSNNWAIDGSKSLSGYPMLANDPHLSLTFPSIWYEVQLSAPGVNVYGVSIPGAPCVIIGYNQSVSWGVTNAEADVQDWYQVRFKDDNKDEYWYKDHWIPSRKRTEEIKVRGGESLSYPVIYTHDGPVVYWKKDEGGNPSFTGYALKWVALDASEELRTFYLLNRSRNYDDYKNALQYYAAPAQNFIFASNNKDIAITSNGKYPLRYQGQGKYVLDGSQPAEEWQGFIPYDQNPTVHNPSRGFVSSANQSATDETYPYYLSWKFGASERAQRINNRLAQMNKATVDSFRLLQDDNYSVFADEVLDTMISMLHPNTFTNHQQQALSQLKNWNRRFDADASGATLFSAWWVEFFNQTWRDDFSKPGRDGKLPSRDRTVELLLTQRDSKWFDNNTTPSVETCADLLNASFKKVVDSLYQRYGDWGQAWGWGHTRRTSVRHLSGIDALGSGNFIEGGSATSVNALSNGFGPSWRMIVELGPNVQGWGILPGGQSGNPGSRYYDDQLETWKRGGLRPLVFLHNATEYEGKALTTFTCKK